MANIVIKTKLLDDTEIVWDKRWIKKVETMLQSTANPEQIEYGVISGTGSIEILDIDGSINNYVKNNLIENSGLPIDIYANGKIVKKNISESSDYNATSNTLTISLTDELSLWKNTKISFKYLTSQMTMFDMLVYIMTKIGYNEQQNEISNMMSENLKYELQHTTINYPYLEEGSATEQLNKICNALQLYIFMNVEGQIEITKTQNKIYSPQFENVINIPLAKQYSELNKTVLLKNKIDAVNISSKEFTRNLSGSLFNSEGISVYNDTTYILDQQTFPNEYTARGILYYADDDDEIYISGSFSFSKVSDLFNVEDFSSLGFTVEENRRNYLVEHPEWQPVTWSSDVNPSTTESISLKKVEYSQNVWNSFDSYSYQYLRNSCMFKIEDDTIYFKARANINLSTGSAIPEGFKKNIYYVQSLSFRINDTTYNRNDVVNFFGNGNKLKSIDSNEFISHSVVDSNNISVVENIASSILSDYANGLSTANITVSCSDYYNNLTKVINFANGDIFSIGNFVKVEGDDNYWQVTGVNFRKSGVPFLDLQLKQLNPIEVTEHSLSKGISTVERTYSPSGASTGVLTNSDPIYDGDVLTITYSGGVRSYTITNGEESISGSNLDNLSVSITVQGDVEISITLKQWVYDRHIVINQDYNLNTPSTDLRETYVSELSWDIQDGQEVVGIALDVTYEDGYGRTINYNPTQGTSPQFDTYGDLGTDERLNYIFNNQNHTFSGIQLNVFGNSATSTPADILWIEPERIGILRDNDNVFVALDENNKIWVARYCSSYSASRAYFTKIRQVRIITKQYR